MKNIKDETIEEAGLPEQTPWESIGDHPRSLADLSIKDGKRLDDTEGSIGDIEDWKGYLDAILDAQTAEIIAEWTFKDSGALAIKVNASNGIWLSPTGILAKKAGVTTFAITSSGDATFGGSLIAGVSIESPVITGGTITGALMRTSSTGGRVEVRDSDDTIRIYDTGGTNRMVLSGATLTFLAPNGTGGGQLQAGGTDQLTINVGGTLYTFYAGAGLDMISKQIYNLPSPNSTTSAARKKYVDDNDDSLASSINSLASIVSSMNTRLTWVENNCCD